ncbi:MULTISPECIES: hypothetical protein [Lysinibacillus]|uniref:hypothetical protein n=1 Tax=Lysinibacillus TaxID=400634 RepID=UPI000562F02A|nr:hypothetical protein [Lysinibacillus sphaericus]
MTEKDYITLTMSAIAIIISIISLINSITASRKNNTKLNIVQTEIESDFLSGDYENRVLINSEQSSDLWNTELGLYILVISLNITNKSHAAISITDILFNGVRLKPTFFVDDKLKSDLIEEGKSSIQYHYMMNPKRLKEKLLQGRTLKPASLSTIELNKIKLVYPGLRIESKSNHVGTIIVNCNKNVYQWINEGANTLTISTPDKKYDIGVNIERTYISNNQ